MQQLRIIVAEDDVLLASLLAEMLAAMGHVVEAAVTNQDDAVRAAFAHVPDLIIIDEKLRPGSGTSAMEAILRARFIPHVIMSGAAPRARQGRGAFLAKPFFEGDLIRAMGAAFLAEAGA